MSFLDLCLTSLHANLLHYAKVKELMDVQYSETMVKRKWSHNTADWILILIPIVSSRTIQDLILLDWKRNNERKRRQLHALISAFFVKLRISIGWSSSRFFTGQVVARRFALTPVLGVLVASTKHQICSIFLRKRQTKSTEFRFWTILFHHSQ